MARYDDLNTSAIGYATFISTILFVIVVLLVRALSFYWVEGEADRLQASTHYTSADEEILAQRGRLSGYAKEMVTVFNGEGDAAVEEEVEQLHIPLNAAKQIILDELASGVSDHSEGDHADDGRGESNDGNDEGHSEQEHNEEGHSEEADDSAGDSEPEVSADEETQEDSAPKSDDKDA